MLNPSFIKAFLKTASPMLTTNSNTEDSEDSKIKSQAFLEEGHHRSNNRSQSDLYALPKGQRTAIKQEDPIKHNPTSYSDFLV